MLTAVSTVTLFLHSSIKGKFNCHLPAAMTKNI